MKCPFCNEEMNLGFVRPTGNGGICWTDEDTKYGAPVKSKGFFRLGKAPYLKGESVPAANCPSCKRIIIDYTDLVSE